MTRKGIIQVVLFLCIMLLVAPAAKADLLGIEIDTGNLYSVSVTDASLSIIGNTGIPFAAGLAYNGTLFGLTAGAGALYTINPTTAAATNVGDLGVGITEGDIAMDSGGNLWAISSFFPGAKMYTINTSTGSATFQGSIDKIEVNGLALRSDGVMVAVGYDNLALSTTPKLFSIDLGTFATTDIASLGFGIGAVSGLAAVGGTGYLATGTTSSGVAGTNSLYELNLFTGATTLIGSFGPTIPTVLGGAGISGLAEVAASVPEPSTFLLFGTGLVGVGILRRRLKK